MLTTWTDVPLEKFLEANIQPEIIIDKQPGEHWWVPTEAMQFKDNTVRGREDFVRVLDGDLVRIPLWAYRTRDDQNHTLIAFAFEMGVRACLSLPKLPARMHIAIGQEVLELTNFDPPCRRIHLGFAFYIPGG